MCIGEDGFQKVGKLGMVQKVGGWGEVRTFQLPHITAWKFCGGKVEIFMQGRGSNQFNIDQVAKLLNGGTISELVRRATAATATAAEERKATQDKRGAKRRKKNVKFEESDDFVGRKRKKSSGGGKRKKRKTVSVHEVDLSVVLRKLYCIRWGDRLYGMTTME